MDIFIFFDLISIFLNHLTSFSPRRRSFFQIFQNLASCWSLWPYKFSKLVTRESLDLQNVKILGKKFVILPDRESFHTPIVRAIIKKL